MSVENMDNLQYLNSLSWLGTYEDMSDVIQYLTAHCLMTPDKLQSLLWFAYAWGLVILNMEIAPFQFVRTPYGPAELNVNELFPVWDCSIIPQSPAPRLNPRIEKLLDAVIEKYGSLSASVLSRKIENHCFRIPAGEDIPAREIYLFFSAACFDEKYN